MKEYLYGKTLNELVILVEKFNQKNFVAKQIAEWLYKKNITKIEDMTNLSKSFREGLAKEYSIGLQPYIKVLTSKDGTKKYLFKYSAPVRKNKRFSIFSSAAVSAPDITTLVIFSTATYAVSL